MWRTVGPCTCGRIARIQFPTKTPIALRSIPEGKERADARVHSDKPRLGQAGRREALVVAVQCWFPRKARMRLRSNTAAAIPERSTLHRQTGVLLASESCRRLLQSSIRPLPVDAHRIQPDARRCRPPWLPPKPGMLPTVAKPHDESSLSRSIANLS